MGAEPGDGSAGRHAPCAGGKGFMRRSNDVPRAGALAGSGGILTRGERVVAARGEAGGAGAEPGLLAIPSAGRAMERDGCSPSFDRLSRARFVRAVETMRISGEAM